MKAGSIYSELKEADMTDIDRKIQFLLIANGYRVINTGRNERSGFNHNVNINSMEYMRGERERVFIKTHDPAS